MARPCSLRPETWRRRSPHGGGVGARRRTSPTPRRDRPTRPPIRNRWAHLGDGGISSARDPILSGRRAEELPPGEDDRERCACEAEDGQRQVESVAGDRQGLDDEQSDGRDGDGIGGPPRGGAGGGLSHRLVTVEIAHTTSRTAMTKIGRLSHQAPVPGSGSGSHSSWAPVSRTIAGRCHR